MTEERRQKKWSAIAAGFIVLVLVVTLLALPSIQKYGAYEAPNGVPRLRNNIGRRVRIPEQSFVVLDKTHASGPHTGVLRYVGYRINDKSGFFDCELRLEAERAGDSTVHTGLSPEDIQQVKVIDEP